MLPNRSTQTTPAAHAWNTTREEIRSHVPLQSPGVLTAHTVHGVSREVDVPPAGYTAEATPAGGLRYRGEYTLTPVTPYAIDDLVKISTGTAAGVYICVVSNPSQTPDTGIGWVQFAPGNSSGDWN